MTSQNDNRETPPAVDRGPGNYEGPPRSEQTSWIQGTNLIILAVVVIFIAVIAVYFITR